MITPKGISRRTVIVGITATICMVIVLVVVGLHLRKRRIAERIRSLSDAQLQRYIDDHTGVPSSRTTYNAVVLEQTRRSTRVERAAAERERVAERAQRATAVERGMADAGQIIVWCVAVFLVILLYFLPYYIARRRDHHNQLAIFWANCFFGMTGVIWLALIVWACSDLQQHRSIMEIRAMLQAQETAYPHDT